jgi:hypothetical protein
MSGSSLSTLDEMTITATELMAFKFPEAQWAVPGIIPEGVTLLAGKPKQGKSWASLGISIAVATGGEALGKVRVERGEALYLALEDNPRRLQKRLQKLLVGAGPPAGLHMATKWPRAGEGGVEALRAWLEAHPDTRLVIIDTLARFKPLASGRRTGYDEDRESVDPLIPVAAEHRVAILLVHHLREMASDDPLDMIHGSAGLTGGVDGALVLKRQRGAADAYLHVDGRDIDHPAELAMKFDTESATWEIVGDAEEYRMSEGRRAISRLLEDTDEPLSPKKIAEALREQGHKVNDAAVREMLSQMVKAGQAKHLGRGAYVHPDYQKNPDNADNLTNGRSNVRTSGMSGHSPERDAMSGGTEPDGSSPSEEKALPDDSSSGLTTFTHADRDEFLARLGLPTGDTNEDGAK